MTSFSRRSAICGLAALAVASGATAKPKYMPPSAMNKIGLGFRRIGAEQRQIAAFTVASDFDRTQSRMTLRLTEASAYRPDDLTVSQLLIDGISMREQVPALDLTSPELAETPNPGLVSGSNLNVSDLAQPLEIGIAYLVSYRLPGPAGATICGLQLRTARLHRSRFPQIRAFTTSWCAPKTCRRPASCILMGQ